MQAVAQQRKVAGIDHVEVFVITLQAHQGINDLLAALATARGIGATDYGQFTVFLLTSHLYQMLTDMLNDGAQIVVIAVGGRLVALALMP